MLQKDNCEKKCKVFNVTKVEKLDESSESTKEICHVPDAESCIMHFSYYHENGKINVKVFKECVHDNFLSKYCIAYFQKDPLFSIFNF